MPFGAPREHARQHLAQPGLRIDDARVDRQAGRLLRKALARRRQAEALAQHVQQVLGLAAVVDRERGIEPDLRRVGAQQARADRVEGAAPRQARRAAQRGQAERLVQHAADAALHLGGGAAREGQQQDALRVGAGEHEPGDARRQRQRLARAGAGDDEQRPVRGRARADAVLDGAPLRVVEAGEGRGAQPWAGGRSAGRAREIRMARCIVDCSSIQPRRARSGRGCAIDPRCALHFRAALPKTPCPCPAFQERAGRCPRPRHDDRFGHQRFRAERVRPGAGARRRAAGTAAPGVRPALPRRVAGPARRADDRRRDHRLRPGEDASRHRHDRARPAPGAGARRRRERRPAARRHQPRAGQRARRLPGHAGLQRVVAALAAPEGAERRDSRRALDGPARSRRHRRRDQRRRPARPRLQRPRLLPRDQGAPQPGDAVRRLAVQDLARQLHDRVRPGDRRAERRLRRRRRRRPRARVLRGPDALGAVRARHVGLARAQRRQGVRDDAARRGARRGRLAADGDARAGRAQRPALVAPSCSAPSAARASRG